MRREGEGEIAEAWPALNKSKEGDIILLRYRPLSASVGGPSSPAVARKPSKPWLRLQPWVLRFLHAKPVALADA